LILSPMMRWSSPSFCRHKGGRRRWRPSSDWWVPPVGRIPNRYPDPGVAGLASWAGSSGFGQVRFSLFSVLFSFLFTLFSVLNFKSDFKSVLQDLGPFIEFPKYSI
jgi:hypothetical protein